MKDNCSSSLEIVPQDNSKIEDEILGDSNSQGPLDEGMSKQFLSKVQLLEKILKGEFSNSSVLSLAELEKFNCDYVIVLINPDFPEKGNPEVTKIQAEEIYRASLKRKKLPDIHKEKVQYDLEIQAFLDVFDSLESIETGKKMRNGGRVRIDSGEVFDTGVYAKDFTTLLRNAILYKLVGNLGLKVKQIMSQTGEYIFLLLVADEKDLEIEAERVRFNKQLEIAVTDLISLLPCDSTFRPLHLLNSPTDSIKALYKKVRSFYRKAFKIDRDTEKKSYKYEPVGVSEGQWETYKFFLENIKSGIKKIKESNTKHKSQMFLFQKLIKDSLEKANMGRKNSHKLKNLWQRLEIEKPIAPYAEYRRSTSEDELQDLWRNHEIDETGKRSLFKNMERIRLLSSYIETALDLNFLEEKGYIKAHFPLHNKWQLNGKAADLQSLDEIHEDIILRNVLLDLKPLTIDGPLLASWRTSLIGQKIPLSKIRNYFGEKIGLYFEFLRFYQISLLVPSIIGLVVFIIQKSLDEENKAVLALNIVYSVAMTIWAVVYLESWKRNEASLSIAWGQTKFEQLAVPRGQFKGGTRRSPITDELDEVHYEESKRLKFFMLSCTTTSMILAMVIGIVAGLIVMKEAYKSDYIAPVASIINAVQIQVFNIIYTKLAKFLTDLENHKTQIQYEDSLIIKTFAFQFVNSFNSLVYIAFIKPYREGCTEIVDGKEQNVTCMNELFIQLLFIFLVSYVKNLVEIGIPYLKYYLRRRKRLKNASMEGEEKKNDLRSRIMKEIDKDYYLTRDKDGTIDDYMELAVQFGYLTLFALAFPLSTSLAFIGLWLEMLTDKLKVVKLVRRSVPMATKDIGTWQGIFSGISIIAIFSNTALFCFTAPTFNSTNEVTSTQYITFGVICMVLLLFRSQIESWIPDLPEKYEVLQARHEYVVSRVLRGEVEENIEEEIETYDGNLYFTIKE